MLMFNLTLLSKTNNVNLFEQNENVTIFSDDDDDDDDDCPQTPIDDYIPLLTICAIGLGMYFLNKNLKNKR